MENMLQKPNRKVSRSKHICYVNNMLRLFSKILISFSCLSLTIRNLGLIAPKETKSKKDQNMDARATFCTNDNSEDE